MTTTNPARSGTSYEQLHRLILCDYKTTQAEQKNACGIRTQIAKNQLPTKKQTRYQCGAQNSESKH